MCELEGHAEHKEFLQDPPTLTILMTQFPMLQCNTFYPFLQDFFFIHLHQAEMSKKNKGKHTAETWYVLKIIPGPHGQVGKVATKTVSSIKKIK